MSGTGKSSVVRELVARGYKAIDTDDGWSDTQPDGRQLWREGAIQALLATEDAELLFVAGCEQNQTKFRAQFDQIILLSAPLETLVARLATRANNSYGKTPRSSVASVRTSRRLSHCCAGWRRTKSKQRCR
jgi:dephospho-CoA kinase